MELFIRKITSKSDYFSRESNNKSPDVTIEITKVDNKGQEAPKHLIITGINGTGKTVLLTSINDELRRYFVEVTKHPIGVKLKKDTDLVKTTLHYSTDNIKYFEPLFITVDDMFMPTRRENFNDYVGFFMELAIRYRQFFEELEDILKSKYLYGASFEKLSIEKVRVEDENNVVEKEDTRIRIKLIDFDSFDVVNMASGHYSFLNIYCHMRFTQFAFRWEKEEIWEFLVEHLPECETLSKNLATRIRKYKNSRADTNSRAIDAALESEDERTEALRTAVCIAQARYKAITDKNNPRSRARDRDIALKVVQALHLTLNDSYNDALKKEDSSLSRDADRLAEKLKPCADKLLEENLEKSDYPLVILIDEPESHLHIFLQKRILPFFVKSFPNAQFIVATHSPFVITSLPDATLFNMENRQRLINDLTLYSYENIVENWFCISTCNDETKRKYVEFKALADHDGVLTGEKLKHYVDLYQLLIKTDFISSVMRINLRKELRDDKIYVLC